MPDDFRLPLRIDRLLIFTRAATRLVSLRQRLVLRGLRGLFQFRYDACRHATLHSQLISAIDAADCLAAAAGRHAIVDSFAASSMSRLIAEAFYFSPRHIAFL